jgi:NADH-quinone oxidoreductase subunit M
MPVTLSAMVLLPITGALLVFLLSRLNEKAARVLAVVISATTLVLALSIFATYKPEGAGFQMMETFPWAESFGLTFTLGIDGISLPLLIISTLLTTLSTIGSWREIKSSVGPYYALLLLFEGSIIGVFTSLNLILFYVFWELVLIPMFFFIGVWGGPKRKYAAMKFLIFTHVGSTVMLLGFIALYVFSQPHTFDFISLSNLRLPLMLQIPMAVAVFFGFAVKLPVVPFHTWLPDAHVEAPAPISVLLAGLLLKMGGYGFIRIMLGLFPEASRLLSPALIGLAVLTMLYGAIVAMVQQDLKRMIALTSINHMGYVLLGTFSFTVMGLSGAVFQMFNHACAIGMLFLMSGVIHHQIGTRTIRELPGLGRAMPITAFLLVLGSLGAMGFPSFASFISEYMVILSAIKVNMLLAIVVLAPAITAGYFVWMLRRVLIGIPEHPLTGTEAPRFELLTLATFLAPLLLFGIYPAPLFLLIDRTVKSLVGLGLV